MRTVKWEVFVSLFFIWFDVLMFLYTVQLL